MTTKIIPKTLSLKDIDPGIEYTLKKDTLYLKYTFPGFQVTENTLTFNELGKDNAASFYQFSIPKIGFISKNKLPLIPSFGCYIQVPGPCAVEADAVKISLPDPMERPKELYGDIWVIASQENWTDASYDKNTYALDRPFYNTDRVYPEKMVEVSGSYEIQGQHYLLVHVTPFTYFLKEQTQKKTFSFYTRVDVKIPIETTAFTVGPAPMCRDRVFCNICINPGGTAPEKKQGRRSKSFSLHLWETSGNELADIEMLIIYHGYFKKEALKLAEWKNRKGIKTAAVHSDDKGCSPPRLKKFIDQIRKKKGATLRYVLLMGDAELIRPKVFSYPASYGTKTMLTDYYFSVGKDETEPELVYPDLSIGRIPLKARTGKSRDNLKIIQQIIDYEKNPPDDPAYYRQITFAGYLQALKGDKRACTNYIGTLESIYNHLETRIKGEKIYTQSHSEIEKYCSGKPIKADVRKEAGRWMASRAESPAEKLKQALKQGRMIIAHRDHGNQHGWEAPEFKNRDIDKIGKVDQPSIVFSLNCSTGNFETDEAVDGFGENLLKKAGVPSLIASTRPVGTWYSDVMMKALFDALWPGLLPVYPKGRTPVSSSRNRIGDILNYAKSVLPVWYRGEKETIKRHFEMFHVLGDPSLEIQTELPEDIEWEVEKKPEGFIIRFLKMIPEGSVITFSFKDVWEEDVFHYYSVFPDQLISRISLNDIRLKRTTDKIDLDEGVTVSFYAPGFRYQEKKVEAKGWGEDDDWGGTSDWDDGDEWGDGDGWDDPDGWNDGDGWGDEESWDDVDEWQDD